MKKQFYIFLLISIFSLSFAQSPTPNSTSRSIFNKIINKITKKKLTPQPSEPNIITTNNASATENTTTSRNISNLKDNITFSELFTRINSPQQERSIMISDKITCYMDSCPTAQAKSIVKTVVKNYKEGKEHITIRIYAIPNKNNQYIVSSFNSRQQYVFLFDTSSTTKELYKDLKANMLDFGTMGYFYKPTFFVGKNKLFILVDIGEDQSVWGTAIIEIKDNTLLDYDQVDVTLEKPEEISDFVIPATKIVQVGLDDKANPIIKFKEENGLIINREQDNEEKDIYSVVYTIKNKKIELLNKVKFN